MNNAYHKQPGQAMIELAIMLLLMTVVTLGMLLVCGMADFADDTLMTARFDAEKNSRRTDAAPISGDEYSNWNAPHVSAPYDRMDVPFNTEERPVIGINSIGSFGENLGDPVYSVPAATAKYPEYHKLNKYHRLTDFDHNFFKHDFSDAAETENMLTNANLVKGIPDNISNNPIGNVLSRSGHSKAVKNKNNSNSSYSALMEAFTKMFGVDPENAGRKIKNAPSSAVYMPKTTISTE